MAKSKRVGLGKGLDALISIDAMDEIEETKSENDSEENPLLIKISKIEPNREQPRKSFDGESLKELAESIKAYGIIQPLVVQKRADYYEIIAGERRWRAAKLAGLKEVPVIIKNYSDEEIMEISIIENIQREDLNPIEEAMAYQKLLTEFNLKHEEIAEKVSKSRSAISNSLRLLKLESRVQEMAAKQELTYGHARALLAIEDGDMQYEAACQVVEGNLSVRDTEKLVKKIIQPEVRKEIKRTVPDAQEEIIYQNLKSQFEQILSTKVNINRKNNERGKIEIEYYSLEELERIFELINNNRE